MASTDVHAAYRHRPLESPRSIRVIRLAPALRAEDPLRCRLVEILLDAPTKPQYWALSYSWDAQVLNHPIRCASDSRSSPHPSPPDASGEEERILNITDNCAAAMRALRDAAEERTLVAGVSRDTQTQTNITISMGRDGEYLVHLVVWLDFRRGVLPQGWQCEKGSKERTRQKHHGHNGDSFYRRAVFLCRLSNSNTKGCVVTRHTVEDLDL
jgi:hypothetical protein